MSAATDVVSVAGMAIWPGLTSVIAYAFLSVSTMGLTNSMADSLYQKERRDSDSDHGDMDFVYDSNNAEKLRLKLSSYPRVLWPTYILFVVLEVAYAGWMLLHDDFVENAWGWYGGVPLLAVTFTGFLVVWTAILNSQYYAVIADTREGVAD